MERRKNLNQPHEEGNTVGSRSPFPVRYLSVGMLFGQEALDYDRQPEATSLLSDKAVADLLRSTGNSECHREYLGQFRSLITACAQMRESQGRWPKEPQWPDERIARAVGALRSTIPKRLDELLDEIELIPEDMRAASASAREIARLRRLLAVAAEEPHLPLKKNDERPISAEVLVQLLDAHYDRAYGPSRAWAGSPKARFIAAAVHRAGWRNKTPAAIEQQLLRLSKKRTIATKP